MLKQLRLENVILVESAIVDFNQGLNVLSGETGSGKSALIEALSLLQGERASTDLIRQKASHAIIEASFDIDAIDAVHTILDASGIRHDKGEYLIIRREIHAAGKSRAFINNQMAQLSLLQSLGHLLIDSVGQHANQHLLSIDAHRDIIDAYGELRTKRQSFRSALEKEESIRDALDTLTTSEAQRLREIEICRMEIEELSTASLKENEEEDLFAEYTLLTNREELVNHVHTITEGLGSDGRGILTALSRLNSAAEKLASIDSSLAEMAGTFKSAWIELQEVSYTLARYSGGLDRNPYRLDEVNERLTLLNKLKRKYGSTVQDMLLYLSKQEAHLHDLEHADVKIDALKKDLQAAELKTNELAAALTQGRVKASKVFSKAFLKILRTLNMPHAEFEVKVEPQKRTSTGDDRVEFYLAPNLGEGLIALKNCASGGELSRVMLSIKALLAGKEGTPILIFDEIDANIGGETASVVGETLADIGKRHQVLCITHFPQVARQAQHHIKIAKEQKDGRTITTIAPLDAHQREDELARMSGGYAMKDIC